jgi:hypothetical protein
MDGTVRMEQVRLHGIEMAVLATGGHSWHMVLGKQLLSEYNGQVELETQLWDDCNEQLELERWLLDDYSARLELEKRL